MNDCTHPAFHTTAHVTRNLNGSEITHAVTFSVRCTQCNGDMLFANGTPQIQVPLFAPNKPQAQQTTTTPDPNHAS